MTSRVLALPSVSRLRAVWLGLLTLAFAFAWTGSVMAQGAAPASFADLSDKVSPAVVNITTSTVIEQPAQRGLQLPEGSPFNDLFRDFLERNGEGQGQEREPQRGTALGSGFVVSADGFIVTNNHVIEGADDIEIEFFSGTRLKAKVVGTDKNTDLAVLKVEAKDLPFVSFGDSDKARVGDWVLAVGNPLGQGFSVSSGIVSARGRTLNGTYDDYIQTDAAINRGNSGGPLFNMAGEVVGINTAILSPTGGSIGIGFAMASNVASKVVAQLQEFGETRRGWLGVRIQDINAEIAEAMGLEKPAGALVTDVPEGPSKEAGLQTNDLIVKFNGIEIRDTRDLVRRVGDAEVGIAVPVEVIRNGKTETLSVTLGRRETSEAGEGNGSKSTAPEKAQELMGLTLRAPNETEREAAGLPADKGGLLITAIKGDSDAAKKGLGVGDILVEAAQQPLNSVADLEKRVEEAKEAGRKSLLLLVRRGGDARFLALSVE